MALEDREVLDYLIRDRRNSKSTVWQRYDALSPEQREALEEDVLSRRARQRGHTGRAILLSIRFKKSGPLQENFDPIKGRSIKIICE